MLLEDYAKTFESKTDDELLRLAFTSEDLVAEASAALNNELSKRGINNAERMTAFDEDEKQRKIENEEEEFARKSILSTRSFQQSRWGKADYVYDAKTGIEHFKTTYFFTLLGLPVVPTGTFLVRKKKKYWWADVRKVKQMPLDWEQVLKVWIVVACVLIVLVWAVRLLH